MNRVLIRNEKKLKVQTHLINKYQKAVLTCSLRLPGELENSPEAQVLIDMAKELVQKHFNPQEFNCYTRASWFAYAVSGDWVDIKKRLIKLEEDSFIGSFLDLDIISPERSPISRRSLHFPPRRCLVCGAEAKICIREQRHNREETVAAFKISLEDFFLGQEKTRLAQRVAELAVTASLLEVASYPSPGLVSPFDSGSHTDMDHGTFIISSLTLTEVFAAIFTAAQREKDHRRLFKEIRAIGICGERKMLRATRGVNTHKGFIFIMGVAIAALGALGADAPTDDVSNFIKIMGKDLVKNELSRRTKKSSLTAGEIAFQKFGITGIRGEVERGLPLVFKLGIPTLKEAIINGLDLNDAMVQALIAIMAKAEDTTLIKRGGLEGLKLANQEAASIMGTGGMYSEEGRRAIAGLHREFCSLKLSPGGVADLLAVSVFFSLLGEEYPLLLHKGKIVGSDI